MLERIETALDALGRPKLEVDVHTMPLATMAQMLEQQADAMERVLSLVDKVQQRLGD